MAGRVCRGAWGFLVLFVVFSPVGNAAYSVANDLPLGLAQLPESELVELMERLENDNVKSDRALDALRKDLSQLSEEKESLENEAETLATDRQKEAKRKIERDAELEKAKVEIQAKQASISMMNVRERELRDQLASLESNLAELSRENEKTKKKYTDPSVFDVLAAKAPTWDPVPRNIFNKTLHQVVPVVSELSHFSTRYQRKISQASPAVAMLASLLVYGFVCYIMYISWKIYKRVRCQLTMNRLIFLGDVICALFWALILVCYLFLFDDPLHVVQTRCAALFFVFQASAFIAYMGHILLRIIVLSCKLSLHALGETLAVTVVGQHYYLRVWQPAIVDMPVRGALFYYMCYVVVFGAFATSRITAFMPLRQHRGAVLPVRDILKIVWATLFSRLQTRSQEPETTTADPMTSQYNMSIIY